MRSESAIPRDDPCSRPRIAFDESTWSRDPQSFCGPRVVKIGGSVLRSVNAYTRCAGWLARRIDGGSRFVVVVSAEYGQTDSLEELALQVNPDPDDRSLDLLWSTGELRSVALLSLALKNLGVDALGLNAHESALRLRDRGSQNPLEVARFRLRSQLSQSRVVVVPGFVVSDGASSITTLGRGGSDLSAVYLAASLQAEVCELIKDVPGYFSEDPKISSDSEPLPRLTFAEALRRCADGCPVVQMQALEVASRHGVRLHVRGLAEDQPGTIVSHFNGNERSTIQRG